MLRTVLPGDGYWQIYGGLVNTKNEQHVPSARKGAEPRLDMVQIPGRKSDCDVIFSHVGGVAPKDGIASARGRTVTGEIAGLRVAGRVHQRKQKKF